VKSLVIAICLGVLLVVILGVAVRRALTADPLPAPRLDLEERADVELKRRAVLDRDVYTLEVDAQRHERWFFQQWDAARKVAHAYASFEHLGIPAIRLGAAGTTTSHAWGISITHWAPQAADVPLDEAAWTAKLIAWKQAGFVVEQSEWHQPRFDHPPGKPATSTINMLLQVVNQLDHRRLTLRGTLEVIWSEPSDATSQPTPAAVSVSGLDVMERTGEPAFSEVEATGEMSSRHVFGPYPSALESLLVYDLRGHGLPDIILGSQGVILRNQGSMRFSSEPLCPKPIELEGGVIADFNGDGLPDLLGVVDGKLVLLSGLPGGRFGPPQSAASLPPILHAQVITAGDIRGKGQLDVLLAQYIGPYEKGSMPTPYYDANDGEPFYLLRNDGHGHFTDVTQGSGLEGRQRRRVYAASFLDLDGAGKMDLLLSSDFAGNDLFLGDGQGRFRDATTTLIDEPHTFGMAHTIADFDRDGHLDLYLVGMSSTTARRLEAMHAGLPAFPDYQRERPAMGYGNRMYLGQGPGKPFRTAPWGDQTARTGWSWGCVSPDFDNDGWPDLFIANGFVSAESSQDYCTTFWRHDIYTGSSRQDPGLNVFFNRDLPDFTKVSWNGYEHKVLYLNERADEGGRAFINVAHIMGVGCEYDGRAVVAADFDGDGKMDLLVEERDFRQHTVLLHLYRNRWPGENHWIGISLKESAQGAPVPGSVVYLQRGAERRVACVITGDSFKSQQPAMVHFGLGGDAQVDAIDIRWGNGQQSHIDHPAADQLHAVVAPSLSAGR
jgi:enediyne biosynthesis protein E4